MYNLFPYNIIQRNYHVVYCFKERRIVEKTAFRFAFVKCISECISFIPDVANCLGWLRN